MKNHDFYNPAMENQYLEQADMLDYEGNFEDMELEDVLGELEGELGELGGLNGEFESFGDHEGDQFFGGLKKAFKLAKPFLRPLAMNAARVIGSSFGGPAGAALAQRAATMALREAEAEGEFEGESESDMEQAGVNPEALYEMSYYANLAAEADNEAEADMFLGAIANIAGNLLPQLLSETDHEDAVGEGDQFLPLLGAAIPLVAKFAPTAIKAASTAMPLIQSGIKAVGSMLNKPQTRHLRRALPQIAARTTMSIARDVQETRPLNPGISYGSSIRYAGTCSRRNS
jgi:hypothetical protein